MLGGGLSGGDVLTLFRERDFRMFVVRLTPIPRVGTLP